VQFAGKELDILLGYNSTYFNTNWTANRNTTSSNIQQVTPNEHWILNNNLKADGAYNNVTNQSGCFNTTVLFMVTNLHSNVVPTPALTEARQLQASANSTTLTYKSVAEGAKGNSAFKIISTMASVAVVAVALLF